MRAGVRDALFAVAMLLVGALLWLETTKDQYRAGVQDYGFDPAFFPRILLLLWFGLCAVMLVRALPNWRVAVARPDWRALAGAVALTGLYVAGLNWVGFFFASVPFALALMLWLGLRHWLLLAAVALLFPLLTWYAFVFLLRIPLPASPWFLQL